jgi:hypothetical protein
VGEKLNGAHQLLVYGDDMNPLGDNIYTTKTYTETLTDPSKEIGLKINTEKTKYMLLSRHQYAEQNHNVKMANRGFENMAHFKYLSMTVTNQNSIQEKIKRKLNLGNACYHSIHKLFLLVCCLKYKN